MTSTSRHTKAVSHQRHEDLLSPGSPAAGHHLLRACCGAIILSNSTLHLFPQHLSVNQKECGCICKQAAAHSADTTPASFYRKLSHCIQSLLWTPVHSLLPWADTHAGWSHQLRDEQPRPPLQAQRMSHLLDFIPRHILRFPWVPPKRCQGPQDTVAHPGLFVCLFPR